MSMILTLLQTSRNRITELCRFVESLNSQINVDFSQIQLVFIDQENNKDVFTSLNPCVDFVYISYHHCSLSHARNIGLKYVKGNFIAFPDDDCWYEADTLYKVFHRFSDNKVQGVCVIGKNEKGNLTSSFPNQIRMLTKENRCAAISYTMFLKYNDKVQFDEDMGVGSSYNIGSGEETDYLLTLMDKYDYKIIYDPKIIVHHPTLDILNKVDIIKKSYSYARGAGYLMVKHKFSFKYKLKQFARPLIGIIMYGLCLDSFRCKKSLLILKGRYEGIKFKRRKND